MKKLMTHVLSLCIFAAAPLLLEGASEKISTKPSAMQDAAVLLADEWLDYIDTHNDDKSWDLLAAMTKAKISKESWKQMLERMHKQGILVSREFSKLYQTDVPPSGDAPEGEYAAVVYKSLFTNFKESTFETVMLFHEADGWRVIMYQR